MLGSLPGDPSLAARQYYGNPRNDFWRLMGGVVGEDLVGLSYDDRLAALLAHGVGLWDVIGEATRPGSLDGAIREVAPNDLIGLVDRPPALSAIGFNGAKAAGLGMKQLKDQTGRLEMFTLPSSSRAHASLRYAEKAAVWNRLKGSLGL